MRPFIHHRGIAAPLLRINIDTDTIIPSREMRTVSKTGLSPGLFAGWRYTTPGGRDPDPEFVLNQPAYQGASILLAGANFGCGSSREHAVWALAEFGIRCIIAPSFGFIFHNNCVRNGLLPIVLEDRLVKVLAAQVMPDPPNRLIEVDLEQRRLTAPGSPLVIPFDIEAQHRTMLLEGLDAIGLTLKQKPLIDAYIQQDRLRRPWAYR